jgi:predicted nuclease of predicted toxin-antitoxin system
MNFLLDENFPKSAEKLLLDLGHEVIDIRGTELQGSDDFVLFRLAQQNQAILLTTDRDFYHTVPLIYEEHCGVIVIALKQPNRAAILSRLSWILSQDIVKPIKNKIILLRDKTYRIRGNE